MAGAWVTKERWIKDGPALRVQVHPLLPRKLHQYVLHSTDISLHTGDWINVALHKKANTLLDATAEIPGCKWIANYEYESDPIIDVKPVILDYDERVGFVEAVIALKNSMNKNIVKYCRTHEPSTDLVTKAMDILFAMSQRLCMAMHEDMV